MYDVAIYWKNYVECDFFYIFTEKINGYDRYKRTRNW